MTVFVRPARPEDAENFTKWFVQMRSFDTKIFQFPETYTLCAFVKGKILGFMIVEFDKDIQVLSRFVANPEATDLEKAAAARELVKHSITLGYLNQLSQIYFVGDHNGTNRIAEHIFEKIPYSEYKHIFDNPSYPVYRLNLKELE